jgi:hypothetical protein
MDVKTRFLNEIIKEEVYLEKPHGFEVHGRILKCVGLIKSCTDSNRYPGCGIP